MRMPFLLSLLVITGCGGSGCGTKTYRVDPEIQPYVDRFVQEGSKVGYSVTVDNLIATIGTVPQADWAGECEYDDTPTITINKIDWAQFDDKLKEQLVFHELGHCVLNRDHNNDVDAYGIPVSLMFWQMSSESLYLQRRGDWIIELFWYRGPSESGSSAGTTIN